jgi:signal peptidase II
MRAGDVPGRRRASLALALVIVSTIGCDRVTKHLAETELAGAAPRSFLADTVRLEYAENAGGFLSLGANLAPAVRRSLFGVGTALGLIAVIATAIRLRWRGWGLIAVALFASGGASNLIDRVVRGSVIDFMNVGVGPVRTGIFNVADVAVMAGAALLAVAQLHAGERRDPL